MSWKLTLSLLLTLSFGIVQLSGQNCGEAFYDSGGPNGNYSNNEFQEWIICPDTPGDAVTIAFTFVEIESGWDFLEVYSGADASLLLDDNVLEPATFTSFSADGCLTLRWSSDGSVTRQGWVATIDCMPPPACAEPADLAISNVTSNTAQISWNQFGSPASWDIEVVPAGTPPTGIPTITGITGNPYELQGLESGTAFDLYLRTQCEGDEVFSTWAGPVSFTTIPGCGDSFYDSGGPDGDYQNNESQVWIFCPDNPGDLVTLDFTFVDVESGWDFLEVYSGADASLLLNDNVLEPATFTSLSPDGCLTVIWSSDGIFAFGGWEATVDCIPPPDCAEPTNLTVSDITSTSAQVSWLQLGPVAVWDIELVPAGTPPTGMPTITGVTDNPYELLNLDSGTAYDLYLRGQCEGDEPFTTWVGPATFTTIPGCGDNFYDSGGPDGNYQNNELQSWTFCPDNPGDLVTLDFTFVDVETPFDDLQVFSGADAAITLELGVAAPTAFTSVSADGCLTVIWDSDGSVTRAGWEATISCIPPPDCAAPLSLTSSNVTSSSALLGWTQLGPVDIWDIEIVPAGTLPTGVPTVTGIMDNPYLYEGLESGTEYDFYVRGQCEGDEPLTEWTGPAFFRTVPGCGDSFFDPGGPDGNYANNVFETYTFCPDTPGEAILIDFTAVELELCCDDLAVYDGIGTDTPINVDVQEPGIFFSSTADGCLTVVFDSDVSVTRPGWEATITCLPCVPDGILLPESVSIGFFDDNSVEIQLDLVTGTENFQIEYDTLGFTPGTGNLADGGEELITLTDLEEGTDYEFYLLNLCEDGTTSFRTGPFFFTTIFTNDVGITGLVAPNDDCGLGLSESIRVAITNFGAAPQTLFPLNFSVNGIPAGVNQPTDGFYTGIISRDSTREFEFDLNYNFDLPGEYTIQLWTEMATDRDFSNDTFTIVLNRFAPPLYEDFEEGLPDYMSTAGEASWTPILGHNNPTALIGGNLFIPDDDFILDLPVMGPIELTDTLFFDYRYVDWAPGDLNGANATTNLTPTDFLSVLVSSDCGETFGAIFLQAGTSHEPSTDLRTIAVPLGDFAGENILIRITGVYGDGSTEADYWLDVDNINLRRCANFTTNATVDNPLAGLDDGQIIVAPEGGLGPFDILWSTGETSDTLSNLSPGEYSVTITDRGGCSTTATFFLEVVNTADIANLLIGDLQLAPNPAPNQTVLRVNFAETVDAQIEVLSTLGQQVWQSLVFRNVSDLTEQIDLSQLPDGVYFLRVQAGGLSKTVRLVKAE